MCKESWARCCQSTLVRSACLLCLWHTGRRVPSSKRNKKKPTGSMCPESTFPITSPAKPIAIITVTFQYFSTVVLFNLETFKHSSDTFQHFPTKPTCFKPCFLTHTLINTHLSTLHITIERLVNSSLMGCFRVDSGSYQYCILICCALPFSSHLH